MKKTMRHSSSMKNKNGGGIHLLEDKLFSQLEKLDSENPAHSKHEDLDLKLLNNTPDALTDLIFRAKGIVISPLPRPQKTRTKYPRPRESFESVRKRQQARS